MSTNEAEGKGVDPLKVKGADAFLRYLKSPVHEARIRFVNDVTVLPELGVWKLSLPQAADLVAVDMFGSGEIEVEVPGRKDDEALSRDDPAVLAALAPQRKMLLERLMESVSNGSLKAEQMPRDLLTGAVDPENTFLDYDTLVEWLGGFGYEPGDWIAEYVDDELRVHEDLVNALFDIRNIRSQMSRSDADSLSARQEVLADIDFDAEPEYAEKTAKELREIVKGYVAEVVRLRKDLQTRSSAEGERALYPKGRNTLHRLIVALCVAAGVDPTERGAAATIEKLTQRVGLPVGDDTIRKVLADLPDINSD
jgi:hypothetical protein